MCWRVHWLRIAPSPAGAVSVLPPLGDLTAPRALRFVECRLGWLGRTFSFCHSTAAEEAVAAY